MRRARRKTYSFLLRLGEAIKRRLKTLAVIGAVGVGIWWFFPGHFFKIAWIVVLVVFVWQVGFEAGQIDEAKRRDDEQRDKDEGW